jgi:hypothetical protein
MKPARLDYARPGLDDGTVLLACGGDARRGVCRCTRYIRIVVAILDSAMP